MSGKDENNFEHKKYTHPSRQTVIDKIKHSICVKQKFYLTKTSLKNKFVQTSKSGYETSFHTCCVDAAASLKGTYPWSLMFIMYYHLARHCRFPTTIPAATGSLSFYINMKLNSFEIIIVHPGSGYAVEYI